MKNFFRNLMASPLIGLLLKETRQLLREKHSLFLLIFPPTVQLLLLGAALDPGVNNLPVCIVDLNHTTMSRQFAQSLTSSGKFRIVDNVQSREQLQNELRQARAQVGVVIPANFADEVGTSHSANVDVYVDGVDAYTANLASNYMREAIGRFHGDDKSTSAIHSEITTLYNPQLKSSWYFIPGVMGAMLTLTSTLVASATLLKEKELGTLEQLMMTPYHAWELLLAKLAPLFFFLLGDAFLAVLMGMLVFGMPFRGSLPLFTLAASLYVCVGMAVGMMLATVCKTERQAHLVSFFVIVPMMQLSGAVVPYETMPQLLREIAKADPLLYFTEIARSLILKGTDIHTLWPNLVALALFAVALFAVSLNRFRSQLS